MVADTTASGQIMIWKASEFTSGKMGADMKVNTEMIRSAATASTIGQTAVDMKVGGTRVSSTVSESTSILAQVERDRCKKIRALCDLAGCGDKFNTFVDAGFSVEETQAALKDLMGKRGSVLDAAPEPPADPNAKYRAEFAQHRHLLSVSEDQYIRSRRIDDGLEALQK